MQLMRQSLLQQQALEASAMRLPSGFLDNLLGDHLLFLDGFSLLGITFMTGGM